MSTRYYTQVDLVALPTSASVRDAINSLNLTGKGIVLVMGEDRLLLGTITDGDIRRVLGTLSLDASLREILDQKQGETKTPITATNTSSPNEWLQLMRDKIIQHLPLIDEGGKVVDLVTLRDLEGQYIEHRPVQAVIMAGGKGTRLMPLTENTPKPMLPIGGKPMLEHIISNLKSAGVQRVYLTTHHLPNQIKEYFQEGQKIRIDYILEEIPLGTAGSLRLIDQPKETLLVMNGDILTSLDYRTMLAYHKKSGADLTVAVRLYDINVPYGVVKVEDGNVTALIEKPTYTFSVNAGIYCLEPTVCEFIPPDRHFHMTELVELLIQKGMRVVSFPVHEYWIDVGRPDDYEKAQQDFNAGKFSHNI